MEITQVYGGRAAITFHNVDAHFYTVDVPGVITDLYQPSVTTVLKEKAKGGDGLLIWACRCVVERMKLFIGATDPVPKAIIFRLLDLALNAFEDERSKAADIGTAVHAHLLAALNGRCKPLPVAPEELPTEGMVNEANKAIRAGWRFLREHKVEVIQVESPRWSPTYGYIGTNDLIARMDDSPCVLDWKTGKRVYDESFLQTAAYQKAWEEEFPDQPLTHRVTVNISKTGALSYEVRDNTTLEHDFSTFLHLLEVHRWSQKQRGRTVHPVIGPLSQLPLTQ